MKSGERSFAFIGQPVSYRFRPDGGVTTEPRNVSADPQLFPAASNQGEKPKIAKDNDKAGEEEAQNSYWIWHSGGLLIAVTILVLFFIRNKSRRRR